VHKKAEYYRHHHHYTETRLGPQIQMLNTFDFPNNALLTIYINWICWPHRFGLKAQIKKQRAMNKMKCDVDHAIVGRRTVPQTWRSMACTSVCGSMQTHQPEHGGMVWKEVCYNKIGETQGIIGEVSIRCNSQNSLIVSSSRPQFTLNTFDFQALHYLPSTSIG